MIHNTVIQAMQDRRSIRAYQDRQISDEQLMTILECGMLAPSGSNGQQWFVSAVQDKALLEEIHKAAVNFNLQNPNLPEANRARLTAPGYSAYFGAPTVLFCAYPAGQSPVNVSFLAENMVLAAHSLGLGSCFLGGIMQFLKGTEEGKALVQRLNLPEGYELAYGLTLGFPAEAPAAKPRAAKFVLVR